MRTGGRQVAKERRRRQAAALGIGVQHWLRMQERRMRQSEDGGQRQVWRRCRAETQDRRDHDGGRCQMGGSCRAGMTAQAEEGWMGVASGQGRGWRATAGGCATVGRTPVAEANGQQ
eukprot:CAMPEP_0115834274 /NCGR_PEP_ID=MMETSP0287-20121206/3600_1 /TAXON_ID=412157 /ORGANISM="Chrysochromulina rotalis, Strain UIO044" /LENGTH=116 /DNA_ID=CAMNT_0003287707 /DNA_START=274 /DNA_END=625 /DNA_ORIENTATION=+